MSIKLIAFDLDGTLFDDSKQIPEESQKALAAASRAGVLLVPATGRILKTLPDHLTALGLFRYFIFANGAEVYDLKAQKTVHHAGISPETAVRLCEYMDTLPVIYDCYCGEWGYMSQWMYDAAPEFFRHEPHNLQLVKQFRIPVPDLKENLREVNVPVEKLQMYFREEDMEERARQLEQVPKRFPELIAASSVSNNIEINSAEAGKGKALARLCSLLGIDLRDSVAFGDGLNDADLLRTAGRGCAMGNAVAEVKANADVIVENNNDAGVGKEIFRLLGLSEQ